jgi:RinA family phage transcriptional activator
VSVIHKTTFRYIEKEIYSYYDTKQRAEELTIDAALSTPPQHEIKSTDISDPTFISANILATHNERLRMINVAQAIHEAILILDPEIYDVLNDKYWLRPYKTWQQIADEHHVDVRTLFRWRSAFTKRIASRLGME